MCGNVSVGAVGGTSSTTGDVSRSVSIASSTSGSVTSA